MKAKTLRAEDITPSVGSAYPASVKGATAGRRRHRLGDAFGLSQFGVNVLVLPPGCDSSLRHWHSREDEFVMVLEGEVLLITDGGETRMQAGECAGFPAGNTDAHCFRNDGKSPARLLEIGSRMPAEDTVRYPDVDMILQRAEKTFRRESNGKPFGD